MSSPKPGVVIDFVIYAGDPDDGGEAVPSERALAQLDKYKDKLALDDVAYGALTIKKDGKDLIDKVADPILQLVTKLVRTISYVIEGEPETVVFSESEHGISFERVNEDVRVVVFRGPDAFEPDEYLLEQLIMPLDDYAAQLIQMGDRILEMTKKVVPERFDAEDLGKGLIEFLDLAKGELRSYRLRDRTRRR
jgi:hypothetical protein